MMKEKPIDIRSLVLKNGLSYPDDRELIMLILGTGTRQMPVEVMSDKILKTILHSNPDEWVEKICQIDGVGSSRALAVAAALELGRRHNRNPQAVVNKPIDVIPFIKHYAMQPSEHFVCITVNGGREIINIQVICVGAGNMAIIKPADIFSQPIKDRASGIILCHNHPGGHAEPSDQDIQTTNRLAKASQVLGLALLDHLIVTKNGYFSFLEHSMLPTGQE